MPTTTDSSQSSHSSPPPSRSTPNRSSSYFTYPINYAVSGVLRRLNTESSSNTDAKRSTRSVDDSSNTTSTIQSQLQSTASSISHSFASFVTNSSGPDMHSVFQPHRTASPFQPPPLTPLTLHGYGQNTKDSGKLLSKSLAEEVRLLIPTRLQLVDEWTLGYSLDEHGVSLATLYQRCEPYLGKRGGYVLVVKDGDGGIFGAYLSHPPNLAKKYNGSFFGTGESFLWRAHVLTSMPNLANLPPPPSADTTHATRMTTIATSKRVSNSKGVLSPPASGNGSRSGTSTPDRIRFQAFPWSAKDEMFMHCEKEYMLIGGGGGHSGLWLDDNLEHGISEKCETFGNEPLSDEGKRFEVIGVELWYIGASF
ncbi:TLD-domain-containing protein [Ophiobolus disseminans]|uniref:Oxidation resistance protein 1 n=1 Tax=Ophiobolus disseminans TaxID=1469910 RepID=A0A6A7A233_9PLEO|nr:TLD-domain-containing protein [Ophiobolus disseminans]